MTYIDLRDLEESEKKVWKEAVEDQGYKFEEVLENEPTMIPDSEWQEYAESLFDELWLTTEMIKSGVGGYIDYEKWADDLKMDYTEIEVDGQVYYFRSF